MINLDLDKSIVETRVIVHKYEKSFDSVNCWSFFHIY
jgi:hypothetical protein